MNGEQPLPEIFIVYQCIQSCMAMRANGYKMSDDEWVYYQAMLNRATLHNKLASSMMERMVAGEDNKIGDSSTEQD